MVWVLKQEINVSMLYPMNWKLLNLCMELQPNVSGDKKLKKKQQQKKKPNKKWLQFW